MTRIYDTERWKKTRTRVRARAGNRCEFPDCGRTYGLDVHHLIRVPRGADPKEDRWYDESLLVALCRSHHRQVTGRTVDLDAARPLCNKCGKRHKVFRYSAIDAQGRCYRQSREW